MTWPQARAVLLTAFLCAVAAYFVTRHNERKRENTPSRSLMGPGPGHPDLYMVLRDGEWDQWEAIETGLRADADEEVPP